MKNLNKKRITGIYIPLDNGNALETGQVFYTSKITDEDGEETVKVLPKGWASAELLEFLGKKVNVQQVNSEDAEKAKKWDAHVEKLKARKAK